MRLHATIAFNSFRSVNFRNLAMKLGIETRTEVFYIRGRDKMNTRNVARLAVTIIISSILRPFSLISR